MHRSAERNIVERYDQALGEIVPLLERFLDEREGKTPPFTLKEELTVEPRIHELLREIRLDVVHIPGESVVRGLLDRHHDTETHRHTLSRSLLDGLREAREAFSERPPKLATPPRKLALGIREWMPMSEDEIERALAELKLNCERVTVEVHKEMRRRWLANEVRPLKPLGPDDDPGRLYEHATTAAAAAGYENHQDRWAMMAQAGHFGIPEVREIASLAAGWPITDDAWQVIADCGQRGSKWDYESRKPYVRFIDDMKGKYVTDTALPSSDVPTPNDLAILTCLSHAKTTLVQEGICAGLNPPRDRKTVGQCLTALEAAGHVSRPHGKRKGYAITDRGRALLPAPESESR